MATDKGYRIQQAIKDLIQSNLLLSVLLPEGETLVAYEPQSALVRCSCETFSGAGLDSRNLPECGLFVALEGEHVDGRKFADGPLKAGHWMLTRPLSTGEKDPLLALEVDAESGVLVCEDPERALAELASCWRQNLDVEIVAVTGTNGKTTTKDLISAMLSGAGKTQATAGNLNNHLGLPLTLLNLKKDTRFAVIEMGASDVGEIKFLAGLTKARVGVITNASAAHLAEFGSLENIIEAKGELLEVLPSTGVAVLNADSPGFAQWRKRAVCPVVSWGQDKGDHQWSWSMPAENASQQLILDGDAWPVPLPGLHNAANLCAAILACRALGISDEILVGALSSFQGSDHRGLLVSWNGRVILDDSYNANPASMMAAVQALLALPGAGRTVAVLGAMAELGPDSKAIHVATGEKLQREKLDFLMAVGETAFPLVEHKSENCEVLEVDGHEEAVDWLRENTLAGDRILIKGSRSSAMERVLKILQKDDEILNERTE